MYPTGVHNNIDSFDMYSSTAHNKSNQQVKKVMYLTYCGLLKVIFSSRSPKAKEFVNWATKILFIIQFGSYDKKIELSSEILNIDYKSLKNFLRTPTRAISCIYLIKLGFVKELRESMNIDTIYSNECVVYKYGFTKDLARRFGEHEKTYNNINNVKIELKAYSFIDPVNLSQAEVSITTFMKDMRFNFEFESFKELVIIPKNKLDSTITHFKLVENSYIGHFAEMRSIIDQLERKLLIIEHKNDILELTISSIKNDYENKLALKDSALALKDSALALKDSALVLKDKELEILNLKMQIQCSMQK